MGNYDGLTKIIYEWARDNNLKVKKGAGRSSYGRCAAHFEVYRKNWLGMARERSSIDIVLGREASQGTGSETRHIFSPECPLILAHREYPKFPTDDEFRELLDNAYKHKRGW